MLLDVRMLDFRPTSYATQFGLAIDNGSIATTGLSRYAWTTGTLFVSVEIVSVETLEPRATVTDSSCRPVNSDRPSRTWGCE